MTEQTPAEGNDSTATYEDHFVEAAREEAGQAQAPHADDRHDHDEGPEAQDSGQPQDGERQEPDPARAAGSEGTDDPWKDAPAHLRELYEKTRQEAEQARNTIKANNGRWSQSQRELEALRSRQSAPASPQAERTQSQPQTGERAERLKRTKDEYPEVAEPILDEITDLRTQVESLLQDANRRTELEEAQARLDAGERRAREEQSLAEIHPDWGQVVLTPEFVAWHQVQPRMVIDALIRNGTKEHGIVDHVEAAKILSDFKRDTAVQPAPDPLAERRSSQLDGSRHIPVRAPALEANAAGGGSHEAEFELARQEELRAARR